MVSHNIVIIGLNDIALKFLQEMQRLKNKGVNILGVHEPSSASPMTLPEAVENLSLENICNLGEKVDVIFDLSGNKQIRNELRKTLFSSNNQHTVIAPESVASLMYLMISDAGWVGNEGKAGY